MELSTFEEIENRAKDILGLTIFDLLGHKVINKKDKGVLGNIIQVNGFFIEKACSYVI